MLKTAEDFGKLVREKRKDLGWTQTQLAAAVGSGERFIVDLENGKPGCHLEKALLAARSVGIELGDTKQKLSDDDIDEHLRFIPRS
jgi:y4mF family transcriptional regulator